jgi:phosphoglucomutase
MENASLKQKRKSLAAKLASAPGNNAPLGGLRVTTTSGWFATRPSGSENVYEIDAESLRGQPHLDAIVDEALQIVDGTLNSRGRELPHAGGNA